MSNRKKILILALLLLAASLAALGQRARAQLEPLMSPTETEGSLSPEQKQKIQEDFKKQEEGVKTPGEATVKPSSPAPSASAPGQDFLSWARFLYPFGLSAAAILAVLMLVMAGVEMMAAVGNPARIESAKGKIWSAVFGLLLAVGSYLILRTINPDLTKLQLNVPRVTVTSSGGGATAACSPECEEGDLCVSGICAKRISPGGAAKPPAVNVDENTKKDANALLDNLQQNDIISQAEDVVTFQDLEGVLKKHDLIGEEDSVRNLDEYIAVLDKWGLDAPTLPDTVDFRSGNSDVVPDAQGFSQEIKAGLGEIGELSLAVTNVPSTIKIEQGFPAAQQEAIQRTIANAFADLPDSYRALAKKYEINVMSEVSYNHLGLARLGIKELSEDSRGITDVGGNKLILVDADPNKALKPTDINPDKNQLYGIITHELGHAWAKENLGSTKGDAEWRELAAESLNIFNNELAKEASARGFKSFAALEKNLSKDEIKRVQSGAADKAGCPTAYACAGPADMLSEGIAIWNFTDGDFRIADSKGNELLQKRFDYLKRRGAIKTSL